jgi:hypothetical protein
MAEKIVKNSPAPAAGTMGNKAFKRSRYEKMETAYGYIPADVYTINSDTLVFNLPAKELIHAKFVFAGGANPSYELFTGSTINSPVSFDVGTTTEAVIHYVIHYLRGHGTANLQIKLNPTN